MSTSESTNSEEENRKENDLTKTEKYDETNKINIDTTLYQPNTAKNLNEFLKDNDEL